MAEEVGNLRVSLALDSANFTQSMASIDRNLKAMGQEMASVRARGNDWGNSLQGLTSKQEALTRMLDGQEIKVRRLREAYEQSKAETGENSVATERLATQLNRATAEYNRTETELNAVREALRRQQDELRLAESRWTQLGERMRAVGAQMQAVGDKMSEIGKEMSMKVTAPIAAVGAASVKLAADFEAQMSRVGAIAGATGGEMDALKKSAMDLGADTSKSASEVAIAMEDMAAMGFTAVEIIGAMPGVISASEASGESLALSAQTVAAALNIWGLEATEAGRVADVLAMAANASAAGIGDMQLAFKYAGAPAAALGIEMEDVAAAIGIMTDAGLDGSNAGTSLRASLLALNNPAKAQQKMMDSLGISMRNSEGNALGLSEMVQNLIESTEHMTEADKVATLAKLVGTEAVSGFLSLMKAGPTEINKMSDALRNSAGESAKTAAIMKDNLKGALEELGGALETAAIQLGNILIPMLRDGAVAIQGLVDKFSDLSPETQKTILVLGGVAAAIGPILVIAGTLISSIGAIVGAFGTVSLAIGSISTGVASTVPAVASLAAAFTALALPIGIAIGAIAAIGLTYQLLKTDADKALESQQAIAEQNLELAQSHTEVLDEQLKQTDATAELINSTLEQATTVDALIASYEGLIEKSKLTTDELGQFLTMQTELANTKSPERIAELEERMNGLREKSGLSKEEFNKLLESNIQLTEQFPEAGAVIDEYGNKIADTTGKLREMTAAELERKEIQIYNQMVEDLRAVNSEIDNYESILTDVVSLEKEVASKKKEITGIQKEVNQNETTQKGLQSEILALKEQQKDASIKEWYQLEGQVSELKLQNGQLDQKNKKHDKNLEVLESTLATEESSLAVKQKQRDKIGELIDKNNTNFEAYTKILDAQFDINFEKDKENESIDKAIGKRKEEIKLLQDKIAKEGDSNGKLQEAIKHLQSENGQLDEAKTKLGNINGTLDTQVKKYDEANVELAKVNNKFLESGKLTDENSKKADKWNEKLDKSHTKDVTINTNKDADEENNKWSKSISKVIEFFTKGKSPDAYAEGTNFHGGGSAFVGEEGPELVKMGNKLQLMDFGLYDLPVGAKVFTHDKTMEMLKNNSIASINNATRLMENTSMPHVNQGGQSGMAVNPGSVIHQEINLYSPKHQSPSENARKFKQAGIELGMAYGLGR